MIDKDCEGQEHKEFFPKKQGSITKPFFICMAILFAIGLCGREINKSNTPPKNAAPVKQETRKEKIEGAFSVWDGSHIELTNYIKSRLRDPKSYEHIETRFNDTGDNVVVIASYRAKNGFGGMSQSVIFAKASVEGKILEIVSQQ